MLCSCKLKCFLNRGYIDIIYNETFYGNHTITFNKFCMRKKNGCQNIIKQYCVVKPIKEKILLNIFESPNLIS